MKKNLLYVGVILFTLVMFLPKNVFAEVKVNNFQETIDEEISTFGSEDSYSSYVNILKNTDLSNYSESDDKVNVYIFRGSTCSHCLDAVTHFASIVGDSGKYFNLKTYEVWSNTDNSDLMNDIAKELGDSDVSGVPYIVIGKKSWSGYASSYDDEMLSQIKSEYNKSKSARYDVIKAVNGETTGTGNSKKSYAGDIISLLVIILVAGGIVFGIITTRKKVS